MTMVDENERVAATYYVFCGETNCLEQMPAFFTEGSNLASIRCTNPDCPLFGQERAVSREDI